MGRGGGDKRVCGLRVIGCREGRGVLLCGGIRKDFGEEIGGVDEAGEEDKVGNCFALSFIQSKSMLIDLAIRSN